MKSRSYLAIRLEKNYDPVGLIVFESLEITKLDETKVKKIMETSIKEVINHLLEELNKPKKDYNYSGKEDLTNEKIKGLAEIF